MLIRLKREFREEFTESCSLIKDTTAIRLKYIDYYILQYCGEWAGIADFKNRQLSDARTQNNVCRARLRAHIPGLGGSGAGGAAVHTGFCVLSYNLAPAFTCSVHTTPRASCQ